MTIWRNLALAAALTTASATALADKVITYTIDPNHTQVHFGWSHFGFSTPEAVFTNVTGTIKGNFDHPEQSSVSVTLPVKGLDTHVPLLNEHLIESGDYFKTKQFPEVTFQSTGLRDIDRDKQTFKLLGNLTVNGITRPVVLDAKVNKFGPHPMYQNAEAAGFNASTTIKRSEFGMSQYVPAVSDDLDVHMTVEAIESDAYKKAQEKQQAAPQKDKPLTKGKKKS